MHRIQLTAEQMGLLLKAFGIAEASVERKRNEVIKDLCTVRHAGQGGPTTEELTGKMLDLQMDICDLGIVIKAQAAEGKDDRSEYVEMIRSLRDSILRLCEDNIGQFERDLEAGWVSHADEFLKKNA